MAATATDGAVRPMQALILVRLLIATLLLGGTLILTADASQGYTGFTPAFLIGLIVATYAASAVFAIAISRRSSIPGWVGPAQLAGDLLLTTALVYVSGAAGSVLTTLYGITILAAAFSSGPGAPLRVAGGALFLYLTVGLGTSVGTIPAPPDQDPVHYMLPPMELIFALFSNLFGLLLVAALAVGLAQRLAQAGGKLRRAEALNEDIIHSLTSGLLTVDPDGAIRSVNPAGAAMLGAGADDLVGSPLDVHFALGADGEARRGEGSAQNADGAVLPIGFSRTPLLAEGGSLIVFTDLTEIHALQRAAERAERLAALGRLAAALAHEIRNPLGSISGSVELVRESNALDPEDAALLGTVLSEVTRLNELVTQMLDVGRPAELRRVSLDLRELAEEVVAMARTDDAFGHVTLAISGTSEAAELDPSRVRQLLWNLLKNAAQASPVKGRITVTVGGDDEQVTLEIGDEGPGVPEAARAHLFDMFYSRQEQGIGLGLAVVKQIVDGHQGRIVVTNRPSGGAVFRVTVPRTARRTTSPMPARDSGEPDTDERDHV